MHNILSTTGVIQYTAFIIIFFKAENTSSKQVEVTNTPPATTPQPVIIQKSPSKNSKLDVDNFVPETDAIENFSLNSNKHIKQARRFVDTEAVFWLRGMVTHGMRAKFVGPSMCEARVWATAGFDFILNLRQ